MNQPKIYYMGKPVRDSKGKFSKRRWIKAGMTAAAFVLILTVVADKWVTNDLHAVSSVAEASVIPTPVFTETMESKVEKLKNQIVTDLAVKCETKDVKEPDAAILLDSNNKMSIGSWMFQITTVQHYIKLFEGRDISRVEAIQIAIDHDKARALATKIIFEDEKGLGNWLNCDKKLGLSAKVELIKQLLD